MTSPLPAYAELIDGGVLAPDPAQLAAAQRLEALSRDLAGYRPDKKSWFRRAPTPPMGLYLWGGVGVGKSLLMDLFVERAPVPAKRRVHFHAFMQEVHRFIAQWRAMDDEKRGKHPARAKGASLDDPIPHAAVAVFQKAHLLCFDEFQVTDITDAMLLGRLFACLFNLGAVVVATSNRHPDDLYKDGLNRQLFLPFIDLLKENLDVIKLEGAKDYRLDRLENENVYFFPLGEDTDAAMDAAWGAITAGATPAPERLQSGSREIFIPAAARGAARATFNHWCGSPLGPGDYLLLASAYPTVFIDSIPKMSAANRNEAKRFLTMIDALYEARCTVFCGAQTPPEGLYPTGDGSFEFSRTVSRLNEMQSKNYLGLPHEGTVLAGNSE